ncbi:excalibur calcium-binding domain-containing protein [Deinococcus sp. MIMF12]|uniref:Excalibur calcium-binding domain-containing protein n=1 Tax=Deinococcus rhizophilus TaxID=3049544 RepID=A0ABT7JEH1_9DEIO|nr:excalibur calcium-binding domain-containing protein [Deinococcus rhizophilus]MDL2343454.1 excalibur calcium-binding domain-containing protein [Deinococcus rhizophilus]
MRRRLTLATLTLGMAAAQAAPSGVLTIRFLDVGQGDAVLVTAPTGQTLLYDGGRSESRMRELIRQYGVTRLDLAAASHGDADHITGLIPAIALFKPKLFLNNGVAATTQTYSRLLNVVGQAGTQGLLAREQVIHLGAVKLTVIPPPPGMPRDDQNANSVGLLIQYGTFRALLTGDSETPQTQAWLRQKPGSFWGPVDVYKSIHHGAANGDSAAWLAAVRPKNVVVSVGPNNYGHPTGTALGLYRKVGATVYRTDQQGTVTVTVQPGGRYAITTERGRGPATAPTSRPPDAPAPSPSAPPASYPNCAAVRAAGKAPLLRGQPGYRAGLDRDGDGVACE